MTDLNAAAKKAVEMGLDEVPIIGKFLAAVVYLFWPETKEDIWTEIKGEVEKEIEIQIDRLVYDTAASHLKSFGFNCKHLHDAIENMEKDPQEVEGWVRDIVNDWSNIEEALKRKGHEVTLLPFYASATTVYLTALREGILALQKLKFPQSTIETKMREFDRVDEYLLHCQTTYEKHWKAIAGTGDVDVDRANKLYDQDTKHGQPTLTNYHRFMTRNVLDRMHYWKSFRPGSPKPAPLTSEVFAPLIGEISDHGPDKRTMQHRALPDLRITEVRIWGTPSEKGAERVNLIGIALGQGKQIAANIGEGDWDSGLSPKLPEGWRGDIMIDNPIVQFVGGPKTTKLVFKNGEEVVVRGAAGFDIRNGNEAGPFEGQIVSRIEITGKSYYHGVGGTSVGFRYEDSYPDPAPVRAIGFHEWTEEEVRSNANTLEKAIAAAKAKGMRLAAPEEVWRAWKRDGLHQFDFGLLSNGSVAVPIQHDVNEFKAGANISRPGEGDGNQGYFYTPICEVSFASQAGVSHKAAQEICVQNGWQLASRWDIEFAMQHAGLELSGPGLGFDEFVVVPRENGAVFYGEWIKAQEPAGFYYAHGAGVPQ